MLGPKDFGLAANFSTLDRYRGIGVELGAFAFRAGRRMAIVGRLTTPAPQDQWQ